MRTVFCYWQTFIASCKVAIQKRGILPVLTSPYLLMNTFIGSTLTIEHIIKAIISAPIRYLYAGAEAATLQALVYDPQDEVNLLSAHIKVIESYDNQIKLVEVPRYKQFLNTLLLLPNMHALTFITIGGQKEILCKIRSQDRSHRAVQDAIPNCTVEFEWTLPTQATYTYAGITVPVKYLKQFMQFMHKQKNEIVYLHDF
jgi:hypothetical protein